MHYINIQEGVLNIMKIGVIGCGLRSAVMLKAFKPYEKVVTLDSIYDINREKALDELKRVGVDASNVHFCDTLEELIDERELDGVIIGTNCGTHTQFAVEVMKRNIPMFLEKPVCINYEQFNELSIAAKDYKSQAVVSFPLRGTPLCLEAKRIIDSGILGEIQQVQAYNNVPYGGVYFHNWYRNDSLTGGLFLQKATHDVDYISYLLNDVPVQCAAMESKQIFKGNKPAGLKCTDCDEYYTCPESPFVHIKNGTESEIDGEYCCFAEDTGNHDSATIMLRCASGRHIVYTQNFFARKNAQKRGARFLGYDGTMEMDFPTGTIKVYSHRLPETQTITIDQTGLGHFGGDLFLAESFLEVMKNPEKPSKVPLSAGIISAGMCLAARASAQENAFKDIVFPEHIVNKNRKVR